MAFYLFLLFFLRSKQGGSLFTSRPLDIILYSSFAYRERGGGGGLPGGVFYSGQANHPVRYRCRTRHSFSSHGVPRIYSDQLKQYTFRAVGAAALLRLLSRLERSSREGRPRWTPSALISNPSAAAPLFLCLLRFNLLNPSAAAAPFFLVCSHSIFQSYRLSPTW